MAKTLFSLLMIIILSMPLGVHCQPKNNLDSLNKELIISQAKNQLAQADYYSKQTNSFNSQWLTIIGTLGGGIIAMLSGLLVTWNNKKNENEKYKAQLQEEEIKNKRIAAAELIKKTTMGFHSMTWVLWIAKNTPRVLTIETMNKHDQKMIKTYPKIGGAQVVLSAYSKKLYEDTEPIVRKLYDYDGIIGRIAFGLRDENTREDALKQLGDLWQEVYDYSLSIPKRFADSLEIILSEPQRHIDDLNSHVKESIH